MLDPRQFFTAEQKCDVAKDPAFPYCPAKLHIYPTYQCLNTCKHCWQSPLRSEARLDPNALDQLLLALPFPPVSISLLGGDLQLLPEDYYDRVLKKCLDATAAVTVQLGLDRETPRLQALTSAITRVSASFDLSRPPFIGKRNHDLLAAVESSTLRRQINTLRDAGKVVTLLVTLTDETRAVPVGILCDCIYTLLDPNTVVFLTEKGQLAAGSERYAETGKKLREIAAALPELCIEKSAPLSVSRPKRGGVGGPIECQKRVSLSLHPDNTVNVGMHRAADNSRRLQLPSSNLREKLHESVSQSWSSADHRCQNCLRRFRCLEWQSVPPGQLLDSASECLGLRRTLSELERFHME